MKLSVFLDVFHFFKIFHAIFQATHQVLLIELVELVELSELEWTCRMCRMCRICRMCWMCCMCWMSIVLVNQIRTWGAIE